jgi:hypothetical protein
VVQVSMHSVRHCPAEHTSSPGQAVEVSSIAQVSASNTQLTRAPSLQ